MGWKTEEGTNAAQSPLEKRCIERSRNVAGGLTLLSEFFLTAKDARNARGKDL